MVEPGLCPGQGELESFALRLPDGSLKSGGAREFQKLVGAFPAEPVHVAIKLVGPGVRRYFEGEAGLHVWQSSARLPEVVKVRVHAAQAPEPEALLALHAAKLQAFHKARQQGVSDLPEDPEAAVPVVRSYRFEPSTRPGGAVVELEDYLLTYSASHRVTTPAEALPTLWRLRMSQNPTGGSEGGAS